MKHVTPCSVALALVVSAALGTVACGSAEEVTPPSSDTGAPPDTTSIDSAPPVDTGAADTGAPDTAIVDSGIDTAPVDSGPPCFVPYGCSAYACATAADAGADAAGDGGTGIVVNGATVTAGPRGGLGGDAGSDAGTTGAGEALLFASGNTLLGSSGSLLQGGVARTMMLWARPSATVTPATLFNYGAFVTDQRFGLLSYANKDYFVGEKNDVVGDKIVADELWHHIAVTYTAMGATTLYVDGAADKTQTLPRLLNTTGFNFAIGTTVGVSSREPFVGSISDIRVYDRVLTAAEIEGAAKFAGSGANPEALRSSTSGLVFWLPLHGSNDIMLNRCAP